MKGTVPCGNQVVLARELPGADIFCIKGHLRMLLFGKSNHLRRNIHTGRSETMFDQYLDETPAAPTADVQRSGFVFDELNSSFQRGNTIRGMDVSFLPELSNSVVM